VDDDLPELIKKLMQPQRYEGSLSRVELVQTHISWVLLAGDFAYKIKKPIKLQFLDFSTLAMRRHYCELELRLNQRYSPEIYLEVLGIYNSALDPRWTGSGPPLEFAVKMRRFPEAMRLDHVCERDELSAEVVVELAARVVAMHEGASRAAELSEFGNVDSILGPALDNFESLEHEFLDDVTRSRLATLKEWTEAEFSRLSDLMHVRKLAGLVRECHGDLHLGNLVLLNGQVRMFDCIEFSENLRWIDVANDIAFVYVDLVGHGKQGLANLFFSAVLGKGSDFDATEVLRFYAVYRALVRAKIAGIRSQQTHHAMQIFLEGIALAESLTAPSTPRLVITHGLSGCGKSVASAELITRESNSGMLWLRADVERKKLYGRALTDHAGEAPNEGMYNEDAHARTYSHLLHLTEKLLCGGWSVVVDATFLRRGDRELFRGLACRLGLAFSVLAPEATIAQLKERLRGRILRGDDASDADENLLGQQSAELEPLASDEPVWPKMSV